jgi:hypothetical protein
MVCDWPTKSECCVPESLARGSVREPYHQHRFLEINPLLIARNHHHCRFDGGELFLGHYTRKSSLSCNLRTVGMSHVCTRPNFRSIPGVHHNPESRLERGQKEDHAKPHLRAAFAFRKSWRGLKFCLFYCWNLVRLHCGDYVCVWAAVWELGTSVVRPVWDWGRWHSG